MFFVVKLFRGRALGEHKVIAHIDHPRSPMQGKFTEAEMYSRRSLAIQEESLGPEHPDVAASLNNRAELLLALVSLFQQ